MTAKFAIFSNDESIMAAYPRCSSCYQTFFSVGDPPATRCAQCIIANGTVEDNTEEEKIMLKERKRVLETSVDSLEDVWASYEESIVDELDNFPVDLSPILMDQNWENWEQENMKGSPISMDVSISPTHVQFSPEEDTKKESQTILTMLKQKNEEAIKNNNNIDVVIFNYIKKLNADLECILLSNWPFFKKKNKNATQGPAAIALELYKNLKLNAECPKDLIVVNWILSQRKDRADRLYGIIPARLLFDMIKNDIDHGGTYRTNTIVTSFAGYNLTYGVRSYICIPPRSRTFCQLIPIMTLVRLHFDIDQILENKPTYDDEHALLSNLFNALVTVLTKCNFTPVVERGLECLSKFMLLIAHRPSKGKHKMSMHVHFKDCFVENNHTVMKNLYQLLYEYITTFDKCIASKNRTMRMAFCQTAYDKRSPNTQAASQFSAFLCTFEQKNERKFTLEKVEANSIDDETLRLLLIHDPMVENEEEKVHVITHEHVSRISESKSKTTHRTHETKSSSIINGDIQQRYYNEREWAYIYNIFQKFMQERKKKYNLNPTVKLDDINEMKQWDTKPTIVFIAARMDQYCEYKGRYHENDTSGTQTGYAFCGIRQIAWQTCFSCRRHLRIDDNETNAVTSFAPGYQEIRVMKPSLYTTLVQQETTCALLFIMEYHHLVKVVPNSRDKKMYIFNFTNRLWECDNTAFIWHIWPLWVNRKMLMIHQNMQLEEEEEKKLMQWVANNSKVDKIQRIITYIKNSRCDQEIDKLLNKKPNLIPLQNAMVYDVLVGELRDRTLDDFFTMQMDFSYDDNAENIEDVNNLFMDFANNDVSWLDYHRRLLGYFMTGFTVDRGFYLWLGFGANGKGTVSNALKSIMAEFFQVTDANFITKSGNQSTNCEAASPTLASLEYARVCMISELSVMARLAIEKLKALTSADIAKARNLYSAPKSWVPHFKMCLQSNYCPDIQCSDQAALDRFRASRWGTRFVQNPTRPNEKKIDANKANALTTKLKNAFGTWCCHGAREVCLDTNNFAKPLSRPAVIEEFMKKTLQQADLIAAFLQREGDTTNPDVSWIAMDMYEAFRAWANRWQSTMASIALDTFIGEVVKRIEHTEIRLIEINNTKKFKGIRRKTLNDDL